MCYIPIHDCILFKFLGVCHLVPTWAVFYRKFTFCKGHLPWITMFTGIDQNHAVSIFATKAIYMIASSCHRFTGCFAVTVCLDNISF